MSILEIILFIAALIVMIVGLAGVILPILPGIPLIFAAAAIYGILTGFEQISFQLVLIFAGLTIFGLVVDYFANFFSVKKMGGGTAGAIGAVIGLLIGIFIHWLAIIILPFVLAVVFELMAGTRGRKALKAGTGAFIGLMFGGLLRFIIGCVMIGMFIWSVLF